MRARKLIARTAAYLWASPYSIIGLLFGLCACLGGAHIRGQDGAIEFSGGLLGKLIARLPPPLCFAAITFGHVILGINRSTLAAVRAHEHVHVRQYERWGLLFGPAYLMSSLFQLVRGRNPYLDNYFEREAYAQTDPGEAVTQAPLA